MKELWYGKAAEFWEEALPLGNGRIGAMVWSDTSLERISLNESSLWSGYPQNHNRPGAAKHYFKAQELVLAGKYSEAQDEIERHMLGHYSQCYLPLGELLLQFPSGEVSGYRRSLNLETAVVTLTYTQNGTAYTRESFVSAEDQAFVMRISADKAGTVKLAVRFSCQLRSTANADGSRLVLEGTAPSEGRPSYVTSDNHMLYEEDPTKRGMDFIALADFETNGGTVHAEGGVIYVSNADSVVIRLCARTSYNGPFNQPYLNGAPYADNCEKDLLSARRFTYQDLYKRHVSEYQALYNRVSLDFGTGREKIPLPERLEGWNHAENDPSLFALLFQYGRYLLVASSRPGTLPANLQGIWNQHLRAPWSSNYTININTEMNYWPAEAVNLSECHLPLLDFLETLRVTGAETAWINYNARGFTAHHNADIWGLSSPVGEGGKGAAGYAFWPLSGGWLSAHAFDYYLYTRDETFLQDKAWPVIRDAARFYLDVMTPDADGTLIFAPSTSPENSFIHNGERCAVSKTATMTTAIIRETLTNAVRCCDILNIDPDFREEAAAALEHLPTYKTGSMGELLEWSEELEEAEPEHRHTSHLYPLYPGNDITPDGTPELAAACRKTLELRGDESTGWALAWRINLWARLGEPDRAWELLKKQVRPVKGTGADYSGGGGCYPNLFGAHPPFQIDANFGACAGIAEMLLQSREDLLILLPALPKALGNGSVKGLRARGGITVSMTFRDGRITSAELELDAGLTERRVRLRYNGKEDTVTLIPGCGVKLS